MSNRVIFCLLMEQLDVILMNQTMDFGIQHPDWIKMSKFQKILKNLEPPQIFESLGWLYTTIIIVSEAWWPCGCALDSSSSSSGLRPAQGYCVVFLGKTPNSRIDNLHPGPSCSKAG